MQTPKTLEMHLIDGKKHLTKAEKEHRQECEVYFGSKDFKMPAAVRADPAARKKWAEVVGLYENSGLSIFSSADIGTISRYCLAYSDYYGLLEKRRVFADVRIDPKYADDIAGEITESDRAKAKLIERMDFALSLGGLLAVDKAINAKLEQILKLEDRLFLNPLAKVRNIPKKLPKKEADPLSQAGFGNV